MKHFLPIVFLSMVLFSCQQNNRYTISGTMADSLETTIYLQQRVDGAFVNVDSALLVKGSFKMNGQAASVDEYYLSKGERDKKLFFLENAKIKVVSDTTLISKANITGGKVQNLFNTYEDAYKLRYDSMLSVYYKARDEQDSEIQKALEKQADSLYESIGEYQEAFMLENASSPVAVHLLTRIQYGRDANELNELFTKLDTTLAYMASYKFLEDRINALRKVAIGATAPDFTQNDPDGNPITFSDVYQAHELTLVDFWASWCGPCRVENPNVVAAYHQFKDKGFTVFGVSLDSDRDRWLKAIADDQLQWQHVSDLRGWDNQFSKAYAVNSIPANFLVNREGIIIATGLREEALLQKLAELLK
ncbi:MAG: AhpC/TSA family protein [Prolixibacteraceae bacterium]|nr:AhpC/TSA family protein [Prolixibacteraceae bacterium]